MSTEKNFAPTARKKLEARKRGEFARSSLLAPAAFLAVVPLLARAFVQLFEALIILFEKSLTVGEDFHTKDLLLSAQQCSVSIAVWLLVVLVGCGLTTALVEISQVGLHLVPGQLWQTEKLRILRGLQQLCSISSPQSWLVSLVRLFTLFGLWLLIGRFTFSRYLAELLAADLEGPGPLMIFCSAAFLELCVLLSFSALAVGVADYFYARFALLRRLRMDREEMKQEFKSTEGNQEVMAMRKQLHAELLAHEAIASVRSARVVVVD